MVVVVEEGWKGRLGAVHSLDRSRVSAGDPSGSRGADSCRTKAPLRAAGRGARSGDAVGKSAAGSDIWDRPVKNKQPERALLLFPWVPAELPDSLTGEDCRHGLQVEPHGTVRKLAVPRSAADPVELRVLFFFLLSFTVQGS